MRSFWFHQYLREAAPGSSHFCVYLYRNKLGFELRLPGGGAFSLVRLRVPTGLSLHVRAPAATRGRHAASGTPETG